MATEAGGSDPGSSSTGSLQFEIGTPSLRASPFVGALQQARDGEPWTSGQESPEHALLKLLPSYVSHLKPGLAAAVTQALLQEADAVMGDLSHLPGRVSATILRLVLAPNTLAAISTRDGHHSSPNSFSLKLRPAMSTGSIYSAPGAAPHPTLPHATSYSPPDAQPSYSHSSAPSPGHQASRLRMAGACSPLQPRPSIILGRPTPPTFAALPNPRAPGLPPLPPASPVRRADSGPLQTLLLAPAATLMHTLPIPLIPSSPTAARSEPLHRPVAALQRPDMRPQAQSAEARLISVVQSTSLAPNQARNAASNQPTSPVCSDADCMVFETASALTTTTSVGSSVLAMMPSSPGPSLEQQLAHQTGKPAALPSQGQVSQQQQQGGTAGMDDASDRPSMASSYHTATSYYRMGSDRPSMASAGDRSSLASDRTALVLDRSSLVSDRSSLVSDRSSMPDRPSTAVSDRSSLGFPDRASGPSDRGSQISSRPSWETGSVSSLTSRTSTVHGSASSIPLFRLRGQKQPDPPSPAQLIKGSGGGGSGGGGSPVALQWQQQRSPMTGAQHAAELAAQGRPPGVFVLGSSSPGWDPTLAVPPMQTTLQHLQFQQGAPLLSALAVRPVGHGAPKELSSGSRGTFLGQSISESSHEDADRSFDWPSVASSMVSTPAAQVASPDDTARRTFSDVGVQVGTPYGEVPAVPASTQGAGMTSLDRDGEPKAEVAASGVGAGALTELAPAAGSSEEGNASRARRSSGGTTGEDDEDSNSDEDVNKAVELLLRRHYPRLASGLQHVLEATCSDAELLRLAAAARSAQPRSLEVVTSNSLQILLVENTALKRRVGELEARTQRASLLQSASMRASAAPASAPNDGSATMHPAPRTNSSSWHHAKRNAMLVAVHGSSFTSTLSHSTRSSSSSTAAGTPGLGHSRIPLSILLSNRLEGSTNQPLGDVGSARSSEAGTELTFARHSSPANSSSNGEREASLTGTLHTSSEGAGRSPNSMADSVGQLSDLERARQSSASTSGTGGTADDEEGSMHNRLSIERPSATHRGVLAAPITAATGRPKAPDASEIASTRAGAAESAGPAAGSASIDRLVAAATRPSSARQEPPNDDTAFGESSSGVHLPSVHEGVPSLEVPSSYKLGPNPLPSDALSSPALAVTLEARGGAGLGSSTRKQASKPRAIRVNACCRMQ